MSKVLDLELCKNLIRKVTKSISDAERNKLDLTKYKMFF